MSTICITRHLSKHVLWSTYGGHLHFGREAILPSEAKHVGQVEGEVEHTAARCRQVGLAEKDAHEEALHDSRHCKRQQEEVHQQWVTVVQHFAALEIGHMV